MEPCEEIAGTDGSISDSHVVRDSTASDILLNWLKSGCGNTRIDSILVETCKQPWALVAFELPAQRGGGDARDVDKLLKNASVDCAVTSIDGLALAFVAHADARRLIDEVVERGVLAKHPACISLPFESLEDLPQQYKLVRYCLDSAEDKASGILDAKECALPYLVAEIHEKVETEGLLHPALAILEKYDSVNRSNLLTTLKVYLENDRNAQQCASKLYLHRNSLQYRVRRIQAIAGVNLDDPKERAYLRLSFMLRS